MRITGGELAGRNIQVPKNGVRPTTDRTREALFSIIARRLPGARFLDLFAGSGSVGFEAWSRGAERVCWVEEHRRAIGVLRENIARLGVEGSQIYAGEVISQLKRGFAGEQFDIIFADPPYDWEGAKAARNTTQEIQQGDRTCFVLAELIRLHGHLADGGLLIIERGSNSADNEPPGWRLIDRRKYGKTKLLFLCREDS